jgi:hypothetical protein
LSPWRIAAQDRKGDVRHLVGERSIEKSQRNVSAGFAAKARYKP